MSRYPTLTPAVSACKARPTTGLVADAMTALKAISNLQQRSTHFVPGHCGIAGNEKVDMLAKQASSSCFTGPLLNHSLVSVYLPPAAISAHGAVREQNTRGMSCLQDVDKINCFFKNLIVHVLLSL